MKRALSPVTPEQIESLVEPVVRLVPIIAGRVRRRFPIRRPNLSDLISVGHYALVLAAHQYVKDHEAEASFTTYASVCIQGAMIGSVLRPEGRRPTSGKVFFNSLEDAMQLAGDHSPEIYLYWREVRAALARALKQLPEDQRLTLVLHYERDFSFVEIGRELETAVHNVKARHRKALKTLRLTTKELFHHSLKQRARRFLCPDCRSDNTVKRGYAHSGAQMHRCRDCKKDFVPIPISRTFEDHRHLSVV